MSKSIGLTRSTRNPDEGRMRRKHRAQQAGLGLRHRPVRIDGLDSPFEPAVAVLASVEWFG